MDWVNIIILGIQIAIGIIFFVISYHTINRNRIIYEFKPMVFRTPRENDAIGDVDGVVDNINKYLKSGVYTVIQFVPRTDGGHQVILGRVKKTRDNAQ